VSAKLRLVAAALGLASCLAASAISLLILAHGTVVVAETNPVVLLAEILVAIIGAGANLILIGDGLS